VKHDGIWWNIPDQAVRGLHTIIPGIPMTKAEIESYRRNLLALRQRLNGDVSHLADEALRKNQQDATGNLSSMPIHMADIGSDNFEQEFTLNLMHNEELVLDEITAALERLDQGTFGRCEECQAVIPKARLTALPYTRHCVACARKLEKNT
jgi:RNA polymerase-binding transcription factor DksA